MVSLDDDWRPKGLSEWLADEVTPLPGADNSIAKAASDIHRSISQHVPLDRAEDWGEFEAVLPKVAVRPKFGEESTGARRGANLPKLREKVAHEETGTRLRPERGGSNENEEKPIGTVDEYNEDSIQFFREDLDPRFDWRLAEEWAQKYQRDVKFVLRGIMACRECCVSPTWFLSRYLECNKDAERREDVEEAHRRILAEERAKRG